MLLVVGDLRVGLLVFVRMVMSVIAGAGARVDGKNGNGLIV